MLRQLANFSTVGQTVDGLCKDVLCFHGPPGLLRVALSGLPLEFGMGLQSKVGIRINQ